jgi:hypothetical protein
MRARFSLGVAASTRDDDRDFLGERERDLRLPSLSPSLFDGDAPRPLGLTARPGLLDLCKQ